MRQRRAIALLGVSVLLVATRGLAHHSFAAGYDIQKMITLSGAVTKLVWRNPHAHLFIDVKDQSGTVTNWDFELNGPNGLLRRGWTRESLKPGDQVTVNGYLARDGSHLVNALAVTMGDGRKVFAGSSVDGNTTP